MSYKIRAYYYRNDGQEARYSSYGIKGSKENYNDLIKELALRYGRYNYIRSYSDYKKELNYIYIDK